MKMRRKSDESERDGKCHRVSVSVFRALESKSRGDDAYNDELR